MDPNLLLKNLQDLHKSGISVQAIHNQKDWLKKKTKKKQYKLSRTISNVQKQKVAMLY